MSDSKETVNVNTQQDYFSANEEIVSWEQVIENERSYSPFVDIYETQDDFILSANMPGVAKENVRLKYEDGSLVIFGRVYQDNIRKKYLLKENGTGNFYRKFKIADSIDDTRIDAKYENGQLTVTLPKHEKLKPRTINIK
jgi:HSP20 family protein